MHEFPISENHSTDEFPIIENYTRAQEDIRKTTYHGSRKGRSRMRGMPGSHFHIKDPIVREGVTSGISEGQLVSLLKHTNFRPLHCGPHGNVHTFKSDPPKHTNNSLKASTLLVPYSICVRACCTAAVWIGLYQVSDSAAPKTRPYNHANRHFGMEGPGSIPSAAG